jgi:hypothetical protein
MRDFRAREVLLGQGACGVGLAKVGLEGNSMVIAAASREEKLALPRNAALTFAQ